jgi:hypothetical protein
MEFKTFVKIDTVDSVSHTDPTNARPELSRGNISIFDNCCTTKSSIQTIKEDSIFGARAYGLMT